MKLEDLRIAIRPRRDWEAVDLGLLMARQWWWPMQRIWLLLTLPWLLVGWAVPAEYLWVVSLSLWWCKPLFERPLLMILSQGVFGVALSTREILRAVPRLFLTQILLSLTWRRFSVTRSMDLPVIQLEGLRGQDRRDRLNVLHRDDSGPASWLTIIGVHVESFLLMTGVAALALFIPQEMNIDLWNWEFWGESKSGGLLLILFSYIAMAVVAPLYVACGFSLYLNRRVKLEGWDLEIAFKRMAQKRSLPTVLILIILTANLLPQAVPFAKADAGREREEIRQQIITIKKGPDFHQMETVKTLKQKPVEPKQTDSRFFRSLIEFFFGAGRFTRGFAGVAELLLWGLVLSALLWVALRYGSWLNRFPSLIQSRRRSTYQPKTLFGMAVTQESLPDDISTAALALWEDQEQRQALALLYRASLSYLLRLGVPLRDGSTELEILHLTERMQGELPLRQAAFPYLFRLTHVWRQLAYGHQFPSDHDGKSLCREWSQVWQEERPHG